MFRDSNVVLEVLSYQHSIFCMNMVLIKLIENYFGRQNVNSTVEASPMWHSLPLLCCYRSLGWKMRPLGRTRNAAAPEAGTPLFGVATTMAAAVAREGRMTCRRKTIELRLEVLKLYLHYTFEGLVSKFQTERGQNKYWIQKALVSKITPYPYPSIMYYILQIVIHTSAPDGAAPAAAVVTLPSSTYTAETSRQVGRRALRRRRCPRRLR